MKNIKLILLFLFVFQFHSNAQVSMEDFGRIVLNTYLPDNNSIPTEAKKSLETKLNQIATNNGMGGSISNPRFIITATVNIGTKDIIAGPPQIIAQNIDITLFIGDAITNTIFSNAIISLKGVGANENKALIESIKTINPKNKEIIEFLEEGKNKILNYYSTQCNFIIKDAQTLEKQEKYEEAIYNLSLVPEVCKECYFKCSDLLTIIYQQKIDADCKSKLSKAKMAWSSQQNQQGAEIASTILTEINPKSSCSNEVETLMKQISTKLTIDEKAKLDLESKQYNDKMNLEKETLKASREVAVEYAKNQPKIITNNNLIWK
jgi:predicted Rdx family selenoprotein